MQIRDFLDALQVEGSQDYLLATVLEGRAAGRGPVAAGRCARVWGQQPADGPSPGPAGLHGHGGAVGGRRARVRRALWGRATAGGLRRRPCGRGSGGNGKAAGPARHCAGGPLRIRGRSAGRPGPTASVAAPLRRSWRRSPAVRRRISSSSPGPTPTIWIASRPSCKSLPPTWA